MPLPVYLYLVSATATTTSTRNVGPELGELARHRDPALHLRGEVSAGLPRRRPRLGLYPIVTSQHTSTTLYHISYHMPWLFF